MKPWERGHVHELHTQQWTGRGLPDNLVVLVERMNDLMRAIRQEADDLIATDQLDPGLRTFLDEQELALHDGGIYFAKMFELNGARTPRDSLTGHEALVNSFHPDEFLGTEQPDWATLNLANSVLLAREVLHRAAALTPMPVDVHVGIDLGGFGSYPSSTFRFYGRRGNANRCGLPDLRQLIGM